MTEASVRSGVAAYFRDWVALLALVIQNNPGRPLAQIIGRPDVADMLAVAIAQAQASAYAAVEEAWPGSIDNAYRQSLLADITAAYAELATLLEEAAQVAWDQVPVPPPSRDGTLTNVAVELARARAAAVRAALASAISWLGTRNGLTMEVAATRRAAQEVLDEGRRRNAAGEHWLKKWVSRQDARVCEWCRMLDRSPPIEIGDSFARFLRPNGHRPPRVYHDLLGPGLHPRCRCRLILVLAEGPAYVPPEPGGLLPPFISAGDIRGMPEDRYRALAAFLRAAVHELAQMLRRIAHLGGRQS